MKHIYRRTKHFTKPTEQNSDCKRGVDIGQMLLDFRSAKEKKDEFTKSGVMCGMKPTLVKFA